MNAKNLWDNSRNYDASFIFQSVIKTPRESVPDVDLNAKYVNDQNLIKKINAAQSSWKAKAYPQHEKYAFIYVWPLTSFMEYICLTVISISPRRAEVTLELLRYTVKEMIRRRGGSTLRLPGSKLRLPATAPITEEQRSRAASLPENFDWQNIGGLNYLSAVEDQASCGSCYTYSSAGLLLATLIRSYFFPVSIFPLIFKLFISGMLESRLRIATNFSRTDVFSKQVFFFIFTIHV